MKNTDLNNLKLEWEKLQKDISTLDKDVTLKSNTFSSLQKQIGESQIQQKKLANFVQDATRQISKSTQKRKESLQEVRRLRIEFEQLKERQRETQKNIQDLTEGKEIMVNAGFE